MSDWSSPEVCTRGARDLGMSAELTSFLFYLLAEALSSDSIRPSGVGTQTYSASIGAYLWKVLLNPRDQPGIHSQRSLQG